MCTEKYIQVHNCVLHSLLPTKNSVIRVIEKVQRTLGGNGFSPEMNFFNFSLCRDFFMPRSSRQASFMSASRSPSMSSRLNWSTCSSMPRLVKSLETCVTDRDLRRERFVCFKATWDVTLLDDVTTDVVLWPSDSPGVLRGVLPLAI